MVSADLIRFVFRSSIEALPGVFSLCENGRARFFDASWKWTPEVAELVFVLEGPLGRKSCRRESLLGLCLSVGEDKVRPLNL